MTKQVPQVQSSSSSASSAQPCRHEVRANGSPVGELGLGNVGSPVHVWEDSWILRAHVRCEDAGIEAEWWPCVCRRGWVCNGWACVWLVI